MDSTRRAWQRWGERGALVRGVRAETAIDGRSGAVHSLQGVELLLDPGTLGEAGSRAQLERLGEAYWRFTTRATLGLVRFKERAGAAALRLGPLGLIVFGAPEYELTGAGGSVRWPIEGGLLVAGAGGAGRGHLGIAVRRGPVGLGVKEWLDVRVSLENFHPALAKYLGRVVYEQTQLRFHALLGKLFLRRLGRLAS